MQVETSFTYHLKYPKFNYLKSVLEHLCLFSIVSENNYNYYPSTLTYTKLSSAFLHYNFPSNA